MSIELVTKFAPKTDEMFMAESKRSLLTNSDYDWTGARTVKVWKISTVPLNDYSRTGRVADEDTAAMLSRYGDITDLNAAAEEMLLKKDRSFIFNVDKLDQDETAGQLAAASALARELRERVIPEVDTYTYGVMVTNAGTKADVAELTKDNIADCILDGSEAMDNAEVPDTERVLVVTPATYKVLKKAVEFDKTDIGVDMRLRGVIAMMDGMAVVRVPASRLPAGFGFMIAHPSATVAPVKLEDYGIHSDTVLSSGDIVTGRVAYDAFVLENKVKGIYYHPIPVAQSAGD